MSYVFLYRLKRMNYALNFSSNPQNSIVSISSADEEGSNTPFINIFTV